MRATTPRPAHATRLAVMAMEAAFAYPFAARWLTGPGGQAPLGAVAALALLPLGYAAARRGPCARWSVGLGASFGLHLIATLPLLAQPATLGLREPTPLLVGLNWLLAAIFPTFVGLAFWWRGTALADAEPTASGVRDEFVLVGCGLLAQLAIFPDTIGIDAASGTVAVVGFLAAGLTAVGLARQAEAGLAPTPAASAQVAGSVVLLLGAGAVLVVLLRPEIAAAVLGVVGQVVGFVLWLLLLPLIWLVTWLEWRLPLPQDLASPEAESGPRAPPQPLPLPAWLLDLLATIVTVLTAVAVVLATLVLLYLLWLLLQRVTWRPGARAPVSVEAEGSAWQYARALADALRGRLARLLGRVRATLPARPGTAPVHDARAAYRALLRWAREHGLPRAPAETPAEFARRLAAVLPAGAPDYQVLTAAYERARYGGQPTRPDDVARLRASLARLATLADTPHSAGGNA